MIVIVTYEEMPDNSPGAIRCNSLAQVYIRLGYDVYILHKGAYSSNTNPITISCHNNNRFIKYFGFSRIVISHLNELRRSSRIDAVITYGFFKSIYHWCAKNDIKCVVDVVEWYSKEQFKRWYFAIPYLKKECEIRNIAKSKANVIAISSFLEKYFRKLGHKTVRIPIITDKPVKYNRTEISTDRVKIIYAGSHILMDNVLLIIKTISELALDTQKRILFSIYGLRRERILQYISESELAKVDDSVKIYGRRPNNEIIEAYKKSHFSIVIRDPELRVNKAGFPSKVIESMKMGVPVICNYSSDLNLYLKDNINCIISNDISQEALTNAILKVLAINASEYSQISLNAQKTVEKEFNISTYAKECEDIIK